MRRCLLERDNVVSRLNDEAQRSGAIAARQYVANINGSDDALVGGDLNADGVINALDYALYNARYATSYGTGATSCATVGPHADISGDGIVGTEDFTFITINLNRTSETPCCAGR